MIAMRSHMPQLSESTRQLIRELWAVPVPRFAWLRSRPSAAVPLLERIAAASEPAAIPDILSFVLAKEEAVARAAARALDLLLAQVPDGQLAWLDERMRQKDEWSSGTWWSMRTPERLEPFDRFGPAAGALLRLASMHPSGFVREAAIDGLSERFEPASIAFLLIRRNDWVPQVRVAAAAALDRYLVADHAHALVLLLPAIRRLKARSRIDHAGFVARVEALLRRPECGEAVAAGLRSPDVRVRRGCFPLALMHAPAGAERDRLLRGGTADADPIVRLLAARALADAPPAGVETLLDRLDADSHAPVRALALEVRVALRPGEAEAAYARCLFDRSPALRRRSQQALAQASPGPLQRYREALSSADESSLDVAVLGLYETGSAADAAVAARFLAHHRVRVRVAALRAVARHDPGDVSAVLYAALRDASPRVSREARVAFFARRLAAAPDALRRLLDDAHRHARLHALALAQTLPRWVRLQFLLEQCRHADEAVAESAVRGVVHWLELSNRAVLSPTHAECEEIARQIVEAGDRLPRKVGEQLGFMLRQLAL